MNQELKAKWVEALRSGGYAQGRTRLELHGAYCCLGVLCRVMGVEIDHEERRAYTALRDLFVDQPDVMRQLWWRNDGSEEFDPHSFAEIADWIEANL